MQPVLPVALSENNKKLRIVLAAIALAVGLVMLGVFFFNLLNKPAGWQKIEAAYASGNCSSEFTLQYDVGSDGSSATAQHKQLQAFYTQITVDAYRIFEAEETFDGIGNLASLNRQPNQPVTVDPALYQCLEKIVSSGDRGIYLANVMVTYQTVLSAENEYEAAGYDPTSDPELARYVADLAAYANDPQSIQLELLGENQVKLWVSDAYVAFYQQSELDRYLDLGWIKNAFIADYLAQRLQDAGYTNGYLASYDGFTRNLDTRGTAFSQNVYDRQDDDLYMPAVIGQNKPVSFVFLRDYPMLDLDRWNYTRFTDGRVVHRYFDPKDGVCRASIPNLMGYSQTLGCADIALQLSPVFIAEDFSRDALLALQENGIDTVWCENKTVCYSQIGLQIHLQTNGRDNGYQLLHREK